MPEVSGNVVSQAEQREEKEQCQQSFRGYQDGNRTDHVGTSCVTVVLLGFEQLHVNILSFGDA